jgi:hypothetical protein
MVAANIGREATFEFSQGHLSPSSFLAQFEVVSFTEDLRGLDGSSQITRHEPCDVGPMKASGELLGLLTSLVAEGNVGLPLKAMHCVPFGDTVSN